MLLKFILVAAVLGGSAKEALVALIEANVGVVVTVELALALARALRIDLLRVFPSERIDMIWESPL